MFDTVLVANRGEIACRVIRACQELGIRAVAVYSDADREALHVRAADVAVPIGPAPATESYLKHDAVIAAAKATGAQAIHPGYGFLSENASFARACTEAGIAFIGPGPDVMDAVGDKSRARKSAAEAGVPTVPGFDAGGDLDVLRDDARLAAEAPGVGFPLLIKAVAGGGGKGMRRVDGMDGFGEALAAARREASAAFGEGAVLLERLVQRPRHVEVQILADQRHDVVLALGERECSIQRRHQKIVEESPAPGLDPAHRAKLLADAVAVARAVGYDNAGTVEFLVEGTEHYFLEVNARLQVEHPVTELVTGIDLVRAQLAVAAGEGFPAGLADRAAAPRGHAIELRIYAEDPATGFLPSPGRLTAFEVPRGPRIRLDAGVEAGSEVTPHYDPMLAKLIVWGADRDEALATARWALDRTHVGGVATAIPFLRALLRAPEIAAGTAGTDFVPPFLERWQAEQAATGPTPAAIAAAAVAAARASARPTRGASAGAGAEDGTDPWATLGAWRSFAGAGDEGATS